jgi:hypothetical protein
MNLVVIIIIPDFFIWSWAGAEWLVHTLTLKMPSGGQSYLHLLGAC